MNNTEEFTLTKNLYNALKSLYYCQNKPPISRYEKIWEDAMKQSSSVLTNCEDFYQDKLD